MVPALGASGGSKEGQRAAGRGVGGVAPLFLLRRANPVAPVHRHSNCLPGARKQKSAQASSLPGPDASPQQESNNPPIHYPFRSPYFCIISCCYCCCCCCYYYYLHSSQNVTIYLLGFGIPEFLGIRRQLIF